jgi:leader peptidase (prepilin peptidase)/N-methyltransferase
MVIIILLVLGICAGSFVNALVWRLHEQAKIRQRKLASDSKLSIVNGRSMCPNCRHQLAPKDLIPILSWILLLGKCRYCHKKIEDNPFTEIALPILFVVSYLYWPVSLEGRGLWEFVFWIMFLPFLLALTVYDLRWKLLPDKIVLPLTALAIFQVLGTVFLGAGWGVLISAAAGVAVISGTFYVIFQISQGKWIGGGDVKLGMVLGLLAGGFINSFLLLFISSLLGSIISIPILLWHGKALRVQVPFGPFLILGLIVVRLFGADITHWYTNLFYV